MRIKIPMAKASSLFVPHLILHSLFPSLFILKLRVIADKTRLQGRVLITDLCLLPCPACIYRTLNVIESIAWHKSAHKSASLHCDAESLNLHISLTKPCTPYIHDYFSLFFCFVLWQMVKWKLCLFQCNRKHNYAENCLSKVELVESVLQII